LDLRVQDCHDVDRRRLGVGMALSGAALVRPLRPECSNVDITIAAATPWLLLPSGGLLA
jgi:hypothetical protein